MSVKYFCDICGGRVKRNYVMPRLLRRFQRVKVEIYVAVDGVWNSGHLCKACVLSAVKNGKDIKAA